MMEASLLPRLSGRRSTASRKPGALELARAPPGNSAGFGAGPGIRCSMRMHMCLHVRVQSKQENGLAPLIKLIGTNHPDLLVNVRCESTFI